MGHRLFVACPVPLKVATALEEWGCTALGGLQVKLVPAEQMHVTLLFFGAVSSEIKVLLTDLMPLVQWEPIHAQTVDLAVLSRYAFAVDLKAPTEELNLLEDRLGRERRYVTSAEDVARFSAIDNRFANEPLAKMSALQSYIELEKKRRKQRYGNSLRLHVTLARSKGALGDISRLEPPEFSFELDKVGLYESHLGGEGSRYELLTLVD